MGRLTDVVSSSAQAERKRVRSCRAVLAVVAVLMLVSAVIAGVNVRNLFAGETTDFLTNLALFSDARNDSDAAAYRATIEFNNGKIAAENALLQLYADRDAAATEEEKNGFAAAIAEAEQAVRGFFENDQDAEAAFGNLAGVIKKDNSALTIATNKLKKIEESSVSFKQFGEENRTEKQDSSNKVVIMAAVAAVLAALLGLSVFCVGKADEKKRKVIAALQIVIAVAALAAFITAVVYANAAGFTKSDRDVGITTSYTSMAKQADKADLTVVTAVESGKKAAEALDLIKSKKGVESYSEVFAALDESVSASATTVSTLLIGGLILSIVAVMTGITLLAGFIHVRRILAYTVLGILSFLCLFFFYLLMINCTRTNNEIIGGISLLPGTNFKANWDKLMAQQDLPVWNGMLNSLIISLSVAGLSTYVSALTAYAIHAYDFKLKNFVFSFILLVMMIPTQVSTLGFIDLVRGFGWTEGYSSYLALILPSMAAPTVFFFMKQYMDSALPMAIIEASRIDGCSEFGTFNRIVLPITKPAIAVQAIFSFVNSWNNYFVPAIVIPGSDPTKKTLPILIATLRGKDPASLDQGMTYMMIALSILPVIIVYLCLSKFIIRGVALGGVKE